MKYKILFWLMNHKFISTETWTKYVAKEIVKLLKKNEDVLKRLKYH